MVFTLLDTSMFLNLNLEQVEPQESKNKYTTKQEDGFTLTIGIRKETQPVIFLKHT